MREAGRADLTVVVVSYNSGHVIERLLDSLPAGLGNLVADVVVVDNDSTDDSVAVLGARSDCTVVRAGNHGYSAGINAGVSAAPRTRAVLVLNPDVELAPGAVPPMFAALGQPGVGIVAPLVRDDDGSLQFSLRREPSLFRALGLTRTGLAVFSEHVGDPAAYGVEHVVDWALGAALLVSRPCHDAVGGWDESFFLYSEETDLCLRARDLGYATVFVPAAEVRHTGGQSGQSPATHSMQVVNRVRLYRRRHGWPASAAFYALILANEATRVARGGGERSRRAVRDLLRPSLRPPQLNASGALIPR